MSQRDKYIVLRTADVQRFLAPEWQAALVTIKNTIEQGRAAAGKPNDVPLFVLSMADTFAKPAIEAYIRAIAQDPGVSNNPGVQEAMRAAQDIRNVGMMQCTPRNPD